MTSKDAQKLFIRYADVLDNGMMVLDRSAYKKILSLIYDDFHKEKSILYHSKKDDLHEHFMKGFESEQ